MTPAPVERDQRLAQLLDEALAEARTTGSVDAAAWRQRYPDEAEELLRLLDTMRALDTAVAECREGVGDAAADTVDSADQPGGESPLAAAPLPAQIGRYRLLDRLGSGGMGTVYRAHDPQLQRVVAVKVPRFEGPPQTQQLARQRFLREARAAAAIRHVHVCPIHDVGEHEGIPYAVMAFVDGQSLGQRLAAEGRYEDCRAAVRLVCQVAAALEAVHGHGIVHRDLKPGNILLDAKGESLLTDFGLARSEHEAEHLTAEGQLVGTPSYMAPEQVALGFGPPSPATDIYSLGVVLHQLVTGRLPFEGGLWTVLYRVGQETPAPPTQLRPDLDPALEAILLKAMARQPADRYATARAFRQALESWLGGAAAPVNAGRAAGAGRRRWLPAAVAAAFLAVVALGAATVLIGPQKSKDLKGDPTVPPVPPYPKVKVKPCWAPLDQLKYENLPASERFEGQPKELVQVLGTHAWRCVDRPYPSPLQFPPLAFKPDDKGVLALGTIYGRKETFIWDAETGRPQMTPLPFAATAWTPDFKFMATSWTDKQGDSFCQVWDVAARRKRCELVTPPSEGFRQVALAPSGKWVGTTSGGAANVKLWDVDTGNALSNLLSPGGSGEPRLSVSADSKRLACGYWTGPEAGKTSFTIAVWDVATKKEVAHIKKQMDDDVAAIAFSPDGRTLAAGGIHAFGSGRVHLWDVDSAKEGPMLWTKGTNITRFAWSPDSKTLACGTRQGPVRLYDTATGKEQKVLTGHGSDVRTLTFAADGKRLASAGSDQTIRVWDVASGEQLNQVPEPVSLFALSPDGRTLAIQRGKGNVIEFMDIVTGNQQKYPPWQVSRFASFGPAAFLRDGKALCALVYAGPALRAINVQTGEAVDVPSIGGGNGGILVAAPDGKTLAYWHDGGDVSLLPSGKTLKGASGRGAFSPDSKTLAVNQEGGVGLWDVATGKQLASLKMPADPRVTWGGNLAFSRDGKRLAAAPFGSPVLKVWDPASRAELATFPTSGLGQWGPYDGPAWIGFGADDRTAISASIDGRITLYSSATERREIRLATAINDFTLSPNGRYAFTSNANGTVYVLRLDVPAKLKPAAP